MQYNLFDNPLREEQDRHKKKPPKPAKTHYRAKIDSFYFPEIAEGIERVGQYDMPVVQPNIFEPTVSCVTPFDRIGCKDANHDSIVMCYLADDRFAPRLTHPWDYISQLGLYSGVIGPDLSQYIDMDYAKRLSNCYWNKLLTAYWQNQGLNVYPNVTWSLPDSYEYSVAGMPKNSVIAINSMGVSKYHFSIGLWLRGYRYMVDALEPKLILRYGPKIQGENEAISKYLFDEQQKLRKDGSKRK